MCVGSIVVGGAVVVVGGAVVGATAGCLPFLPAVAACRARRPSAIDTPATRAENARRRVVGAILGESGGVAGALRSVYSGGTPLRGVWTGGGAGATRAPAGRRSNRARAPATRVPPGGCGPRRRTMNGG